MTRPQELKAETHPALRRPQSPRAAAPNTKPRFSALEWAVIALARREELGKLETPGHLSQALATVFGHGCAAKGAGFDPRLEALRRITMLVAHGCAVPAMEIKAFRKAGFGPGHLDLLVDSLKASGTDAIGGLA